jgi:hypothetical protein
MKKAIITSALVVFAALASTAAYACKDGGCCCDCAGKHETSTDKQGQATPKR